MELPPYRVPTLRSIGKHVVFRTGLYLRKIGGVILLASVIVWFLSVFPRNVEYSKDYDRAAQEVKASGLIQSETEVQLMELYSAQKTERQAASFIGIIGRAIEPVMQPLGFDWRLSVSLLSGIAAKEVVVSTLGVMFQTDPASPEQSLVSKIQTQTDAQGNKLFTPVVAFSFMLFILVYFPCIGVVAAIRREAGSWKWAAFIVLYTTAVAWLLSFTFFQVGSMFF
jgi:ferrous iron transport protein B